MPTQPSTTRSRLDTLAALVLSESYRPFQLDRLIDTDRRIVFFTEPAFPREVMTLGNGDGCAFEDLPRYIAFHAFPHDGRLIVGAVAGDDLDAVADELMTLLDEVGVQCIYDSLQELWAEPCVTPEIPSDAPWRADEPERPRSRLACFDLDTETVLPFARPLTALWREPRPLALPTGDVIAALHNPALRARLTDADWDVGTDCIAIVEPDPDGTVPVITDDELRIVREPFLGGDARDRDVRDALMKTGRLAEVERRLAAVIGATGATLLGLSALNDYTVCARMAGHPPAPWMHPTRAEGRQLSPVGAADLRLALTLVRLADGGTPPATCTAWEAGARVEFLVFFPSAPREYDGTVLPDAVWAWAITMPTDFSSDARRMIRDAVRTTGAASAILDDAILVDALAEPWGLESLTIQNTGGDRD